MISTCIYTGVYVHRAGFFFGGGGGGARRDADDVHV